MHINEVYEKLTKRAWEDEAFKQKLLSDPKAAIKEEIGAVIPDSVKVTVIESKPDDLHFVLPVNPKAPAELSDSDLDQVAGGNKDANTDIEVGPGGVYVETHITIQF